MTVQVLLDRLNKVRANGAKQYRAQCPCEHKSAGQLSVKELDDGRILIHCHAGHSPVEIMESLDLSLSDLFEERIDQHIRPLYLAEREKRQDNERVTEVQSAQLRLDMASDMRRKGIQLTAEDIKSELTAFNTIRGLS